MQDAGFQKGWAFIQDKLKVKIHEILKCLPNVPWKLYISCPKGPAGPAPARRHFGSRHLDTVDILGVDILAQ